MALPPFLVGDDLLKFRTRHCQRFVKQGFCNFGDKCQYSHSLEWTRRPLWKYNYAPQLCHFVYEAQKNGKAKRLQHSCCLHRQCPLSHSYEEQVYHPKVYKRILCESFMKNDCYRYYCPFAHGNAELQGEKHLDSDLLKIISVPQDVLCPLNISSLSKPSVSSTAIKLKGNENSKEIHDPWSCSTKLSCYKEKTMCDNDKNQQLKLNYSIDELSSESVLPSLSTPSQEEKQATNIEYDCLKSLKDWTLQSRKSGKCFHNTDQELGKELIEVTSQIYYNPSHIKFREEYFPLDSKLKPFIVTCFEGIPKFSTKSQICVLQITNQDHDLLLQTYAKLHKLYKCQLGYIYYVTLKFCPSLTDNHSKPGEVPDLWVVCLESSFANLFPKDILLEPFQGFLTEKPLKESLIKIETFLQEIAQFHSVGVSHGCISPWILDWSSLTYQSYLGHVIHSVLPLTLNQINTTFLLYRSAEVLKAILSRSQKLIEENQTLAADVWSCGVCIFVWLAKHTCHPYGVLPEEIFRHIVDDEPSYLEPKMEQNSLLCHLIANMLRYNPLKRISVHQALSHPIFWEFRSREFFLNLLYNTLSLDMRWYIPEHLNHCIHWADEFISRFHHGLNEDISLKKITLFIGYTMQQLLFFVHQAIEKFTQEYSLELDNQQDIEAWMIRFVDQQSPLGLLYFICLLFVEKSWLDDVHVILSFFSQQYASSLIHLQTFLWETFPEDTTWIKLNQEIKSAKHSKPWHLDACNTGAMTTCSANGLIHEARQRSLYIPIKPCLRRSSSALPDDIFDEESTTASSSCPQFVQSLLSFMSDAL